MGCLQAVDIHYWLLLVIAIVADLWVENCSALIVGIVIAVVLLIHGGIELGNRLGRVCVRVGLKRVKIPRPKPYLCTERVGKT